MENFILWLGGKLTQFETTLLSPFFALGQKIEILFGAKGPNVNYNHYLKALFTVQNFPYHIFLDALVNEYRTQGNLWMEEYFRVYFSSAILPALKNGRVLKPYVADASANCRMVSELATFFKTNYGTVLFADIPLSKSLLAQLVFSKPDEQFAWVKEDVSSHLNTAPAALAEFFFVSNMTVKQLLLNIQSTFDNEIFQSVLVQLQPLQNLREILRNRLTEQPIYGSTRLGVRNLERNAVFANYFFEKKHPIAEPEDPAHPLLVAPAKPQ